MEDKGLLTIPNIISLARAVMGPDRLVAPYTKPSQHDCGGHCLYGDG